MVCSRYLKDVAEKHNIPIQKSKQQIIEAIQKKFAFLEILDEN